MHTDVADARRWAVGSGKFDAARIAVVGGSWGGYLALGAATGIADEAGEAGEAGAYAAVVGIVPLVAVGAANTAKAFRGDPIVRRYWADLYGPRVASDLSAAAAISPVHRLDKLEAKLLLVHGEDDPRVPKEHGEAVAAAAQAKGVVGAHMTFAREGHNIRREPNVLLMWHVVERFLCSCLALPPPPQLEARWTEGHTATVRWAAAGATWMPSD